MRPQFESKGTLHSAPPVAPAKPGDAESCPADGIVFPVPDEGCRATPQGKAGAQVRTSYHEAIIVSFAVRAPRPGAPDYLD